MRGAERSDRLRGWLDLVPDGRGVAHHLGGGSFNGDGTYPAELRSPALTQKIEECDRSGQLHRWDLIDQLFGLTAQDVDRTLGTLLRAFENDLFLHRFRCDAPSWGILRLDRF